MTDLYEKDIGRNEDKNALETSLATRLSSRATRQYVGRRENLKERVRGRSGMAYLGAAGWYIPVPTVLGALVGQWLDKNYPYKSVSWSLNLILLGLAVGMLNMWYWLKREGIDRADAEQKARNEALEEIRQELQAEETSETAGETDYDAQGAEQ